MHIGDVHLDQRRPQFGARVTQRHRRVGERAGVEYHRVTRVGGRMNPVQQLGFAVALSHNGFQAKLVGFAFDQRDQFVVRGAAVDLGLAAAEPAQVGAVEHEHCLS